MTSAGASWRRVRRRAAAGVVLAAAALAPAGVLGLKAEADDATTAIVLRVVDGDTVDVVDDTRGRLRIRVIGIDSPEATVS